MEERPNPFMQRILRRGGVVRKIDHTPDDPTGVSDGRHESSLRGLGRKRPGSAAVPENYLEHGGIEFGDVSGLEQLGTGSYTGPAMAVSSYTSQGVFTNHTAPSNNDGINTGKIPLIDKSWEKGYAADDPNVIGKIFGIRS